MTQKTRLVKMIVYGCQMNFAEAERMEGQLREIGFESTEDIERAAQLALIALVADVDATADLYRGPPAVGPHGKIDDAICAAADFANKPPQAAVRHALI